MPKNWCKVWLEELSQDFKNALMQASSMCHSTKIESGISQANLGIWVTLSVYIETLEGYSIGKYAGFYNRDWSIGFRLHGLGLGVGIIARP